MMGVGAGIYLVKEKQIFSPQAAPATTIYFQGTSTTEVGQETSLFVLVDTNTNALAIVRLEILYDPAVISPTSLTFNSTLLQRVIKPPDLSVAGKITGSAAIELNSPLISGSRQQIATLTFTTIAPATSGTILSFGTTTAAFSGVTPTGEYTGDLPGRNLIPDANKQSFTLTVNAASGTTPTPTSGVNPTPTANPAATATPTTNPAATNTPTPQIGGNPTSTPTTNPAATATPTRAATTTPTQAIGGQPTTRPTATVTRTGTSNPTPTLPVSGSFETTALLFGGGLLLLFLALTVMLAI